MSFLNHKSFYLFIFQQESLELYDEEIACNLTTLISNLEFLSKTFSYKTLNMFAIQEWVIKVFNLMNKFRYNFERFERCPIQHLIKLVFDSYSSETLKFCSQNKTFE